MKSEISHNIKHRIIANDIFMTPPKLAKELIDIVPIESGDTILDSAKGEGAFFNAFPEGTHKFWCENREGIDFFKEERKFDWIITNPPYSILDNWIDHTAKHSNKGFCLLINTHSITPKRVQEIENYGFSITKIHLSKVFRWYGIAAFIVCEKGHKSILSYDRVVWK